MAQTFFMDDEMQRHLKLDGVITLVDTKHIVQHIDDSEEVQGQIAFADVIFLLNKTDLVAPAEVEQLETRLRTMNGAAKLYRIQNAQIEMDKVLNVGGFDLNRAGDRCQVPGTGIPL